jgi:hypothetical protein
LIVRVFDEVNFAETGWFPDFFFSVFSTNHFPRNLRQAVGNQKAKLRYAPVIFFILKNAASLSVYRATLLQLFFEVIQYPQSNAQKCSQYPVTNVRGIGNPLTNKCYLQNFLTSCEDFVRGLPIPSDSLEEIFRKFANTL